MNGLIVCTVNVTLAQWIHFMQLQLLLDVTDFQVI